MSLQSELNALNAELASIQGALNYEKLIQDVVVSQQKLAAATITKLGTEINQTIAGFTSLTQQVDKAVSDIKDAVPGGIALLTQDPDGVKITKPAPTSPLSALTEDSVGAGFLNLEITLGTPQAVATAIKRVTNLPATALKGALSEITPQIAGVTDKIDTVLGDIQKGIAVTNELTTAFNQFGSKLQSQIKGPLLDTLQNLPNTLSEQIEALKAPINTISSSRPINPVSADVTFVSSQVEAQAILSTTQREITELVVGTTQTFKDTDVRASNAQGWHFIITRDGELQQVTNIDAEGSYAKNHNRNTIGLAFAGGLAVTGGEAKPVDRSLYTSSSSITREQWNTFDKFLSQFYAVFPYGQVLGVSDIETTSSVPGFDVIDYVRQRFGKITIVDTTKPAPSLAELQAQMATARQKVVDPKIEDEPGEG